MFRNYFKIAIRIFKRHKGYSFINISGLAIGMAACVLILLWIQDETSYDRFHKNAKNLCRVVTEFNQYGEIWEVTSIPLAPALKQNYPEIINATRYVPHNGLLARDEIRFTERGAFVDASFLNMFSFPFLQGNPKTAFVDPFSIVITEVTAKKYFGDENPMGKTLKIDNENDYTIRGILRETPQNSHIRFHFLLPIDIFLQRDRDPENWGRFGLITYVQLSRITLLDDIEKKIAGVITEHKPESDVTLHLQPITRIHLYNVNGGGKIEYIYIFSIIALFIIFIACLNFMNLTTARSSTRVQEIGMRKVTGAHRIDLFLQFMGESLIISIIGFAFAIVLVLLLLPIFNNVSGKQLTFTAQGNVLLIMGMVALVFITGILSGSYPALYLSSFKPILIAKGAIIPAKVSSKSTFFRKCFVVSQFSISVFLIISTMVISKQLSFIQNKDLGFDSEHVLYIPMKDNMKFQYESLKNELSGNPDILSVSATSGMLKDGVHRYQSQGFQWEGKKPEDEFPMNLASIDYDYLTTLKMELAEGRGFSREHPTDATNNFLVNETAIHAMGIESPLDKGFAFQGRHKWREGKIIGVIKDYHFQSLHSKITPLVIIFEPDRFNYFCIRFKSSLSRLSGSMEYLEKTWNKIAPNHPFEYSFLDEEFDFKYRTEQRTRQILGYFTFLAIFISCLGLFGLTSFSAERRTKEIGIRKVLGASVSAVIQLFSKEFLVLVAVSNIIACPLAYCAGDKWLQSFAYRIQISHWVFIMAGILTVTIALTTVSYQTLKTALANPVDSLRYE